MATETCEKHSDCMERIHEAIHRIELSSIGTSGEIKGFVESINGFLNSVRKDIYSKDGLMERTGKHGNQINLQWGLLGCIIIAVVLTIFKK